jgi:hypothetical protein
MVRDIREAASPRLAKMTLLLAGLIAEGLLLIRHPDKSDVVPVWQAS